MLPLSDLLAMCRVMAPFSIQKYCQTLPQLAPVKAECRDLQHPVPVAPNPGCFQHSAGNCVAVYRDLRHRNEGWLCPAALKPSFRHPSFHTFLVAQPYPLSCKLLEPNHTHKRLHLLLTTGSETYPGRKSNPSMTLPHFGNSIYPGLAARPPEIILERRNSLLSLWTSSSTSRLFSAFTRTRFSNSNIEKKHNVCHTHLLQHYIFYYNCEEKLHHPPCFRHRSTERQ